MDSRWYLGESRVDELLDYALAQLARRAYLVDPSRYLRVKTLLESRIPLWVEERRGPLDTRGYPLYSLKAYKDFITWWVKALTAPVEGETTMKGGWVDEVFGRRDPAGRVFGGRVMGAAEPVAEFEEFGIGKTRSAELKAFCLEFLYSLVGQYAGTPGVQEAVASIMKIMSDLIDGWAAVEKTAPRDPATGQPYPSIPGPGQLERMREAMGVMLTELVRTKLAGLPPQKFGPMGMGAWEYYGQKTPAFTSQPILQPYASAFGVTAEAPGLGSQWSFADLVGMRGDAANIAYQIQSENWAKGWKAEAVGRAVTQALAAWPKTMYTVSASTAAEPNGVMDPATLSRYTAELKSFKDAVVGALNAGAGQ